MHPSAESITYKNLAEFNRDYRSRIAGGWTLQSGPTPDERGRGFWRILLFGIFARKRKAYLAVWQRTPQTRSA